MVNFVVLLADGNIKDQSVNLKAEDRNKPIQKIFRFKKKKELFISNISVGKGNISEIFRYKSSNCNLIAYGYLKGKKKK